MPGVAAAQRWHDHKAASASPIETASNPAAFVTLGTSDFDMLRQPEIEMQSAAWCVRHRRVGQDRVAERSERIEAIAIGVFDIDIEDNEAAGSSSGHTYQGVRPTAPPAGNDKGVCRGIVEAV